MPNSHSLALEWPPNHSPISNGELRQATSRENATLRDVEGVHDGDDVISTCASAFHVLQQLPGNQLVHIPAKVGWVQGDLPFEIIEEEHLGGSGSNGRCGKKGTSITGLQ